MLADEISRRNAGPPKMAGSLSQYWKKRDFGVTSEPRGKVARAGIIYAALKEISDCTAIH